MQIKISATRQQLLLLAKRLKLARRGHKLLKDKLDGLVQKFFGIKSEYEELYASIEKELTNTFKKSVIGYSLSWPEEVKDEITAFVEVSQKNIMGVKTEEYTLSFKGEKNPQSKILMASELVEAQEEFDASLPKMVELAAKSFSLRLMAEQIIETRRRVNALEYVLIPELEKASAGIKMKLSELERSSQVTLLKIKDIVRSH